MLVIDGVLESLIQDGKTIDLIQNYLLQCCNLNLSINELKPYIDNLYDRKLIKIVFPHQYVNLKYLNEKYLEEYWFELSTNGEQECIKRGLMTPI